MTKMKTLTKGLLGASVFSLIASTNAFAEGTAADTPVSNTFTLTYEVDSVEQPVIDTGDTGSPFYDPTVFTVDRLIDLTVGATGNTTVAPGATGEDLIFSVTNTGNDTQAYDLTVINESTGDVFDSTVTTITYYLDSGPGGIPDGMFDPLVDNVVTGTYTTGTATPDVNADGVLWVVVTSDIPGSLATGNDADVSLVADTLIPSTDANAGDPVVADTVAGNDLLGPAENVLADLTGTTIDGTDTDFAGDHSATASYVVASANVTAAKAVSVFSQDGANCATIPGTPIANALAIPGSCVEYVISATNAAGTGAIDATAIAISDVLPTELTFVSAQVDVFTGGSFSQPATNADCSAVTCTVSLTGATLAPGNTGTITIRALVN